MKSGQGWVSITSLWMTGLSEFIQLAGYDEVRVRARRVRGSVHDSDALSKAEHEAQQRRDAEAAQKEASGVQPIYIGPPWIDKRSLPVVDVSEDDFEFSPARMLGLPSDHDVWRTGNLEQFDVEDPRVRLLFRGIEYWSGDPQQDVAAAPVAPPPGSRTSGGPTVSRTAPCLGTIIL